MCYFNCTLWIDIFPKSSISRKDELENKEKRMNGVNRQIGSCKYRCDENERMIHILWWLLSNVSYQDGYWVMIVSSFRMYISLIVFKLYAFRERNNFGNFQQFLHNFRMKGKFLDSDGLIGKIWVISIRFNPILKLRNIFHL